ncbi:hypothetical protein GGX14DRAFT_672053 [Mycena pura]|uniref:Transcription factor domain-containing protein n=1 Tax=Mycena pura TaxID=153505 RepID=A0AAD6UZ34_9AGAR|nr:hypothetical protein GGX14DRAFT_672053 [Mycena pura]
MLRMLLDHFLPHASQFGFFLHVDRFRASAHLQLPLGHPDRPSPALLCAVYLWGIHLSQSDPLISYETVFIRRAQQHLATEMSDSVHPGHRMHTIQAHILLSVYFLRNRQFLKAQFHTNGAVTLALGYRLHKIRSAHPAHPAPPLLPVLGASAMAGPSLDPPRDDVEEGERIRGFWAVVCHQNSLAMTARMVSDSFGILDSPGLSIDTPWPLDITEYERGVLPRGARSSDTVQNFIAHGAPGPAPRSARIAQFSVCLSPLSAYYERGADARTFALAHALVGAARIQLHNTGADAGASAGAVGAARAIIGVFGLGDAHGPDFLCAGPAAGTLLLLACQVVLREIARTRCFRASLGSALNVDVACDQEEAALLVDLQNGLTTMTLHALNSPLVRAFCFCFSKCVGVELIW